MVWPRVKEGRRGYTKKMLNMPLVGKRRLRWYGHLFRKEEGEVTTKKMLNMPLAGKRRLRLYGHLLRKEEGALPPRRC